jgi:hypothetical protein
MFFDNTTIIIFCLIFIKINAAALTHHFILGLMDYYYFFNEKQNTIQTQYVFPFEFVMWFFCFT